MLNSVIFPLFFPSIYFRSEKSPYICALFFNSTILILGEYGGTPFFLPFSLPLSSLSVVPFLPPPSRFPIVNYQLSIVNCPVPSQLSIVNCPLSIALSIVNCPLFPPLQIFSPALPSPFPCPLPPSVPPIVHCQLSIVNCPFPLFPPLPHPSM